MLEYIFLDSAPLSLLATPIKRGTPTPIRRIRDWAESCDCAGISLFVPEITDYEVRRELLRCGKDASIRELDRLKAELNFLPITTAAMLKAAELWAEVRRRGMPTAGDGDVDVDVILAAQALTTGFTEGSFVIATSNIRHLSRFASAELWENIHP